HLIQMTLICWQWLKRHLPILGEIKRTIVHDGVEVVGRVGGTSHDGEVVLLTWPNVVWIDSHVLIPIGTRLLVNPPERMHYLVSDYDLVVPARYPQGLLAAHSSDARIV